MKTTYSKGEETADVATFENKYEEIIPDAVTITPSVIKNILGENPKTAIFEFVLNGNGYTDTVTIEGAGKANFKAITLDTEGTYEYIIKETKGNALGYTYDESEWKLTVTLTKSEEDGQFIVETNYSKNSVAVVDADAATFENKYKDVSSEIPETGDTTNMLLWFMLMIASLIGIAGTTIYSKRKKQSR